MSVPTPSSRRVGATLLLSLALVLGACDDDDGVTPPDGGIGQDAGLGQDGGGTPDAAAPSPDTAAAFVDLDIAVVRLNENGTLDNTFGSNGVARVDFGPGAALSATTAVRDHLWGLAGDAQKRVVLFGSKKAPGSRTDTDRVVARVSDNGALDSAFGTMGFHTLDIAGLNDTPKHGLVQPDGKIVASGYTSQPTGVGTQSANRIVLLRLDAMGMPDNTFGATGVVNAAPFVPATPLTTPWGMAEAYSVGYQDGKYVTTGYGRAAASGQVDLVSFRFNETGAFDTTWGTNGLVSLDIGGDNDRGRNLVVLADNRVIMFGSATPSPMAINAMVKVVLPTGAPDTSFAPEGYKLYDFGRPNEAFYGAAVSPSGKWAAGTGFRAGAAEGDAMAKDDSILVLLPLQGGTEVNKAVPISTTDDDRFSGAAFDASDRLYAAGYVVEGGDSRMVVARYDTTGTLDPTFGTGGVVKINVSVGPGVLEQARGIVVQADGKIVIAGEIEKR